MPVRVLSFIVLAGTSWCILDRFSLLTFLTWSKTAFQILFMNSCLGIAKYGFQCNSVDGILHYTKPLESILVYPLLVGQMWLNVGYLDFALLHPIFALIPYINYLNGREYVDEKDFVITFSMVSCVIISIESGNAFGIIMTILIGFAHLERWDEFSEEQKRDIYNYLMCVFEIFAVNAIARVQVIYV